MVVDEKVRAASDHSRGMTAGSRIDAQSISAMVLGVGAFAYSTSQILRESGTDVSTYLTRDYAHHAPSLAGPTFHREQFPSPCPLIRERRVSVVIPMSIDWAQAPWRDELLQLGVPIFSPTGEAMRIERERDFARSLCHD